MKHFFSIILIISLIISACSPDNIYSDNEAYYGPPNEQEYHQYSQTPTRRNSSYRQSRKERPGRLYSAASSSSQQIQSPSNGEYSYTPEFGGYASAGHQQHYSHSHHSHVNGNAVSLLGFLTLLYLIQNVLNSLTTTAAPIIPIIPIPIPIGRKVRSVEEKIYRETKDDRIIRLSLPLLSVVSQAGDGKIPLTCVRAEFCLVNRVLVKEMGDQGRMLGNMLGVAIGKIFKRFEKSDRFYQALTKAGQIGRNGQKCERIYKPCKNSANLKSISDLFLKKAPLDSRTMDIIKRAIYSKPSNIKRSSFVRFLPL